MNELISANTLPQTTMDDTVPKALGRLDMMLLLALGGDGLLNYDNLCWHCKLFRKSDVPF